MKKTSRKLKSMLLEKEANLKKLHIVRLQLYDIWEKAKLWRH